MLASLEINIVDGSVPIGLFLGGEDRYRINGFLDEFPLSPSSGSPGLPVAIINGDVPVPIEVGAWGTVKLMYR